MRAKDRKEKELIFETLHHIIWVIDELRQPYLRRGGTFEKLSKDIAKHLAKIGKNKNE